MTKRWRAASSICAFLLVGGVCYAQTQQSYQALLERLQKGDTTIDFGALRMAFAGTDNFDPYPRKDERREMFGALNAKDYKKALDVAGETLKKNYVSLSAHYVSAVAHRELKRHKKAQFHRGVFLGLIDSIRKSGDGRTAETAFVVISVEEEHAFLAYMGYRVTGQALHRKDGHVYDRMDVVNSETNEKAEFYFNIDKVFGFWDKALKNG